MSGAEFASPSSRWTQDDDRAVGELFTRKDAIRSGNQPAIPRPERPRTISHITSLGGVSLARECPLCNGLRP